MAVSCALHGTFAQADGGREVTFQRSQGPGIDQQDELVEVVDDVVDARRPRSRPPPPARAPAANATPAISIDALRRRRQCIFELGPTPMRWSFINPVIRDHFRCLIPAMNNVQNNSEQCSMSYATYSEHRS